jgi:hypothetical protein
MRRQIAFQVTILCTAIAACNNDFSAMNMIGPWGGPHAAMVLTTTGGTMEYDCASGTISNDWTVTPDGLFAATGRHLPGHGGPIPIGGGDTLTRPARYQGTIRGHTMTLTVVLTDSATVLGVFDLTQGRSGSVFKCL